MTKPDAPLTCIVPACRPDAELLADWGRAAGLPFVREVVVVRPRGATIPVPEPPAGVRIVEASLGRGSQMNAGATAARSELLFFVHGDTRVDEDGLSAIASALHAEPDAAFALSLRFDSSLRSFRLLERMSRVRNRVFPFPLGDQGLALRRARFLELGGFRDEPLFEDVIMSWSLRRTGPVRVLPQIALTDAGRFERRGVLRHFAHNFLLCAWHALGASPRTLVCRYYGHDYLERWVAADPGRRGPAATRAPAPSPSS